VLVRAGTHGDFSHFARPEESIDFPIELIRELTETLSLKPMRGSRKIAILDDADDLNDASANAFLKTLEEPPPGSILFLIGGPSVETQLSTIVSRCQVIHFSPLKPDLMRQWLATQEIHDPTHQQRLIRLSGGSPGQAQALDESELWEFRKSILASYANPLRNSAQTAKEWMTFILQAGTEGSKQRRRADLLIRFLIEILQSALQISCGSPVEADDAELRDLQAIASRHGTERLLKSIDRCLEAEMHNIRLVQLVLLIEGLHDSLREPLPVAPARR
jgi:DNA polymerase-3 subunit delta'